ncbi:MAG: acyl carrier protein [Ruminococcaceae bacterium]|nr:acyl carrier protein [Oscillospiraceae bacterium]
MFEKIRKIIASELMIEEDSITPESSIKDDLGADSLALVDLVMSLEDEFNLEIPDEALESVKTVGDIVKFVEDNGIEL